jgi:hypothetical protein
MASVVAGSTATDMAITATKIFRINTPSSSALVWPMVKPIVLFGIVTLLAIAAIAALC